MSNDPGGDAERELIDRLAAWLERRDAGEPVDPAAICDDRPDLLPLLERMIAADAHSEAVFESLAPPDPSQHTTYPTIEGFEVVAPLGVGGRGQVFLARDVALSRFVAIKLLRHEVAGDANERRRFLREAEIAASLDHRNIVPVYAVGETDQGAYIAMKWLGGPALDEVETPLASGEVARIGIAIARALQEAHAAGIIHRDVKPGNIMFDGHDPCILDFGLARLVDDTTMTGDQHVSGTLPYMSPEQLRAGRAVANVDARTDIYSLGATLYELATGEPPFVGPEPATLIRKILLAEPPAMKSIDRDLQTIIVRALDKDRERRFGSAAAFADDLERYVTDRPIESRRIGALGRFAKLVRRHPRASTAIGASVATALLATAVLVWRADRERRSIEADFRAVEREVDRGRYPLARAMLDSVRARADDPRTSDAIERRIRANETLEQLIDLLASRTNGVDHAILRDHVDDITGLGGPGGDATRQRTWQLARAAAWLLVDDRDATRSALESVAPGRGRAALLAAADDRAAPWTLPSGDGDRLAHQFTVIAMLHADYPEASIANEIGLAEAVDARDPRTAILRYLWDADGRDEPAVIREGLEWLRELRPTSRTILRLLLRQCLALGDRAAATRVLDTFVANFPQDRWIAIDASTVIEAKRILGQEAASTRLFEWGRERWTDDWFFVMMGARQLAASGKIAAAESALTRARDLARVRRKRDETDQMLLQVRWHRAMGGELPTDDEQRQAAIESLRDDAVALADRTEARSVRSGALVIAWNAARALSREPDAVDALAEEAFAASPTPDAALAVAWTAFLRAQRAVEAKTDPATLALIAQAGRPPLERLQRGDYSGGRRVTRQHRASAEYLGALLAHYAGDTEESVALATRGLDSGLLGEQESRNLENLKRLATRAQDTRGRQ